MNEVLSAAKCIKALHEASEIVYIPASILAIWSQFAPILISGSSWGQFGGLMLCCAAGLLGSVAVYQAISFISPYFQAPPFFPVLSVCLIGIGLIVLFQGYMPVPINGLTHFTGFALVAWGFMLDVVHNRILQNEHERITGRSTGALRDETAQRP